MMSRILFSLCVFLALVCTSSAGGRVSWLDRSDSLVVSSDLKIETMIREQIAYTSVRQTFLYEGADSTRVFYGFDLPANAVVTDLRWKINGEWHDAEDANSNVSVFGTPKEHRMLSPARWFGPTPFLRLLPQNAAPNSQVEIEIVYVELLTLSRGRYAYAFPIGPDLEGQPYRFSRWLIDIRSQRQIEHPMTQGVEADSQWVKPNTVTYLLKDGALSSEKCGCYFVLRNEDLLVNVISTKRGGEDGYAVILVDPESTADSGDVMPKRFTFVVDHSGSMSGERMEQAKTAAEFCVRRLNQGDLLNLIKFDTYSESWRDAHVPLSPEVSDEAVIYIQNIRVRGGTDIMQALKLALSRHQPDQYVNVIIFVTDGQADIDQVELRKANTSGSRIFVFGIGDEVNTADLIKIATLHNGSATFIRKDPEIVFSVSDLFTRINDPLMKDPIFTFEPDVVHSILPTVVPDLYRGEQVMLVARYSAPGENTLTVSGSDLNGPRSFRYSALLNGDPSLHDLVSRIWARYRVEQLTQMMQAETNVQRREDLTREINTLAVQYGFITPQTRFDVRLEELVLDGALPDGVMSADISSVLFVKERCEIIFDPERDVMNFKFDLTDLELRNVRVEVQDLSGKVVALLADLPVPPPTMNLEWQISQELRSSVAVGQYYLAVMANGVRMKRLIRTEK